MSETQSLTLVVPATGEALDLTGPDGDLAEMFDRVRDLERQLRDARDVIAAEITRRCDSRAKWSWQAGGYKVSVPSPALKDEWDVDALRATLLDLWSEGSIDEEACDAALEPVPATFKPRAAGLNALRKLGGEVAERVDSCRVEVEPVRRVSVRPA